MDEQPRTYREIQPLTPEEVAAALERNDPGELLYVALSTGLYASDPAWAEGVCLRLAAHPDEQVRGNAVLALGHLARLHRTLTPELARPAIESALTDPSEYVRGQADAAADDVRHFLRWRVRRLPR